MIPPTSKKDFQTFFRMVTKISAAFGRNDEVLYVVDRTEKRALEQAKHFIEEYLSKKETAVVNPSPAQTRIEEHLAGALHGSKKRSEAEPVHAWNETESISGPREWTLGGSGDGIRSDDIFQCGGKKAFGSIEDANCAAESCSKSKGERFKAYKCRYCRSYHIGGDR